MAGGRNDESYPIAVILSRIGKLTQRRKENALCGFAPLRELSYFTRRTIPVTMVPTPLETIPCAVY
jgi:hypothetical protein